MSFDKEKDFVLGIGSLVQRAKLQPVHLNPVLSPGYHASMQLTVNAWKQAARAGAAVRLLFGGVEESDLSWRLIPSRCCLLGLPAFGKGFCVYMRDINL